MDQQKRTDRRIAWRWATTAIVKYAAVANEIRLRLSIFRSNVVVVDVMLLLFIKNFTEIWMKLWLVNPMKGECLKSKCKANVRSCYEMYQPD